MTAKEADAWAKGSKYADKVFYHGTKNPKPIIDEGFKIAHLGEGNSNGGLFGAGHYITPKIDYASHYAGKTGEVFKIKINVNKVLTKWDDFNALNSKADEITYLMRQIDQKIGKKVSLAKTKKLISSGKIKWDFMSLNDITSKEWDELFSIYKNKKFAIEEIKSYMIKRKGYEAIVLEGSAGQNEIVLLYDNVLTIIK